MKTLLFLIALLSWANSAHATKILYSERRDADSFKRISEHLTGKENPGRYAITRTDPSERNGYYVAIKLDASDSPQQIASIRIQLVRPRSLEVETQSMPIDPIDKSRVLIGLTDGNWGQTDEIPTAWKIEFFDAQGATVTQSQSFLWKTSP